MPAATLCVAILCKDLKAFAKSTTLAAETPTGTNKIALLPDNTTPSAEKIADHGISPIYHQDHTQTEDRQGNGVFRGGLRGQLVAHDFDVQPEPSCDGQTVPLTILQSELDSLLCLDARLVMVLDHLDLGNHVGQVADLRRSTAAGQHARADRGRAAFRKSITSAGSR